MKKLFLIVAFVVLFLGLGHLYYMMTGDFRLSDVLTESPYDLTVRLPELTVEERLRIVKVIDQDFYFLGHGHQTYAFVSEDQKYVLKLFKADYLQRSWMINIFPPIPPFRQFFLHRGESREYRMRRLLNGYAIAYALDRENSGLLYFQPNIGNSWDKNVQLIDKLGLRVTLDLDAVVFAIQEKAVTTRNVLHKLLSVGDVAGARRRIRQLLEMYLSEYQRGIFDHDHNLIDNTGFVGDRAIRQDVGKIVLDEEIQVRETMFQDLQKIIHKRLGPWIQSHYPRYYPELSRELERFLETDADWQNEYANVVAKLARKEKQPLRTILEHFSHTIFSLSNQERDVEIADALKLAIERKISVYDAQFVLLAKLNETCLVTEDKEIVKKCSDYSLLMKDFLGLGTVQK